MPKRNAPIVPGDPMTTAGPNRGRAGRSRGVGKFDPVLGDLAKRGLVSAAEEVQEDRGVVLEGLRVVLGAPPAVLAAFYACQPSCGHCRKPIWSTLWPCPRCRKICG